MQTLFILAAGAAEHGEDHGPTLLGLSAEGWVYVGLTIFILLAITVGKAPKRITDILDARIAETIRELEQAKALRAEAEAVLAAAKTQQAASHNDAEAILAHAKTEAADLIDDMESEASKLIQRRQKMAVDKIAAAERSAIASIKGQIAGTASTAAAALIASGHDGKADKALVDATIGELGTRLN